MTGKAFEEMLLNLRKVFDRLKGDWFKLKAKKCCLFAKNVIYLGHVVEHWPVPTNVNEVCFCLLYYRKFIKDFSTISKCLHTLTEKGTGFKWTSVFQSAFDILKFRPTNAPIHGHPDFNHQFFFDTDASNESIGAGLSQNIDGTGRSVNAEPEKNYLRLYTLWNISELRMWKRVYCANWPQLIEMAFPVQQSWETASSLIGNPECLQISNSTARELNKILQMH